MFTTLPLELFVCREVIEQYFFPHEPFNMQRHIFFTTAILCSSMISTQPPFPSVLFQIQSNDSRVPVQSPSSPVTSASCSRSRAARPRPHSRSSSRRCATSSSQLHTSRGTRAQSSPQWPARPSASLSSAFRSSSRSVKLGHPPGARLSASDTDARASKEAGALRQRFATTTRRLPVAPALPRTSRLLSSLDSSCPFASGY